MPLGQKKKQTQNSPHQGKAATVLNNVTVSMCTLTHVTSCIPVRLWIKVAGVHSVVWRIDPQKLPLIEADQVTRLQLKNLIHDGLVEGRHLPAVCECWGGTKNHQNTSEFLSKNTRGGLMCPLQCLPCVSMSCTRTDLVYMTRSDSALDNLIVFLFLKGALLISTISITAEFTGNKMIKSTWFHDWPYLGW